MSERALYLRLSAFYLLYYGAVGCFVPYWPLYLRDSGHSAWVVGMAFAVLGTLRIGVPLLWGRVMDRRGQRMPVIVVTMLICSALFAAMPHVHHSLILLLGLHAAYALFWNAALPAFDVITLHSTRQTRLDYSQIRLWGSVGFVVTVLGCGALVESYGAGVVHPLVAVLMLAMVALGLCIPDARGGEHILPERGALLHHLRQPGVVALLVTAFLSQLAFAPFYSFFSIYLQEHGYSSAVTGQLWALGVIAEIGIFVIASRLLMRYGVRATLLFSLATAVLRWALLALAVDQLYWLAFSQFLHFASFGLYHTATVVCMHRLFPEHLHGQAQALLAGLSFGAGGAVGNLMTGYAWDALGGTVVFMGAAVAAALGWLVVAVALRDPSPQPIPDPQTTADSGNPRPR
ncbi:MAG: MFS transporter [Algiphilus sp.]